MCARANNPGKHANCPYTHYTIVHYLPLTQCIQNYLGVSNTMKDKVIYLRLITVSAQSGLLFV